MNRKDSHNLKPTINPLHKIMVITKTTITNSVKKKTLQDQRFRVHMFKNKEYKVRESMVQEYKGHAFKALEFKRTTMEKKKSRDKHLRIKIQSLLKQTTRNSSSWR